MNLLKKVLKTGLAITILAQLSISCNMYEPKGTKNSDVASGSTGSSGTADLSQIFTVTVETLSDGTGTKIPATITLAPAESQRVFAIGRDINGGFISLVTVSWATVNSAVADITFTKANTTVIYGKSAGSTTVTTTHKTLPVDDIDVNVSAYGTAYKLELSTNAADEDNILTTATTIVTVKVLDQFDNLVANYDEPAGPPATTFAITFKDSTNISVRADETINFVNGVYSFNLTYTSVGTVTMRMLQVTGSTTTLNLTDNKTLTFVPASLHHFTITNLNTTMTAGTTYSLTLTAEDANNNTITDYNGTVTFSEDAPTNSDATASVPTPYTFTATDLGVGTFGDIRFTRSTYMSNLAAPAGDGLADAVYTITATAGAVSTNSADITVSHSGVSQFIPQITDLPVDPSDSSTRGVGTYTTFPYPIYSDDKFSLYIRAEDQFNNHINDFTGTATLTATGSPVLPAAHTFIASELGIYNFTLADNPLRLKTSETTNEEQTVTISSGGASSNFTMTVYPEVCPTGYIWIPARTDVGTDKFCVAKYEMYNEVGYVQSSAAETPYVGISASDAFTACTDILTNHPNGSYESGVYSLISNREWMAIARNIELGAEGDDGYNDNNMYTADTFYVGHSDSSSSLLQASATDSNGYFGTGDTAGLQRRTFNISSTVPSEEDVIWDFSGNASEWVDFDSSVDSPGFTSPNNHNCMTGLTNAEPPIFEFTSIDGTVNCENIAADLFSPSASDHRSRQGMGTWTGANNTSGAIVRGGSYRTNEVPGMIISLPAHGIYYDTAGVDATVTSFTVRLATQPMGDVTVAVSEDHNAGTITSAASLTFTNANWDTEQTVIITATDLIPAETGTSGSFPVAVNPSSHNIDKDYDSLPTETVNISWGDANTGYTYLGDAYLGYIIVEVPSQVAGATDRYTGEDLTTGSFNVRLGSDPVVDTVVTLAVPYHSDEVTLSAATLTFTAGGAGNWNVNQTVTVTGVNDADTDGDINIAVYATVDNSAAPRFGGAHVNIINVDNDSSTKDGTAGIIATTPSSAIYYDNGTLTSAKFSVRLKTQPSGDVDIAVSDNSAYGASSTTSLRFTTLDWDIEQTITVQATSTLNGNGSGRYAVTLNPTSTVDPRYESLADSSVEVIYGDGDTASTDYIIMESTDNESGEGGETASVTIRLPRDPGADEIVTITEFNNGDEITVSATTLTFTTDNWSTGQVITVTGVDDDLYDGHIAAMLHIGSPTFGGGYVYIYNKDNEKLVVNETAGMYFFSVDNIPAATPSDVGFRCVYRPGDD